MIGESQLHLAIVYVGLRMTSIMPSHVKAKGGYVMMRHNCIRDLEAEIMQEVCSDVRIEPELMPLDNNLTRNGNNAENARLDVSGIGVWGPFERTFLDIRVMHPNAPSYVDKSIGQVYIAHEKEKKRAYSERVIQMEKGMEKLIDITSESLL